MDRVLINPAIVSDIADAVREKKKNTDQIEVAQLPDEIRSIKGVGDNVKEVVEAVTGVVTDDDTILANAIARASVDTPTEQIWSGERQTAGGTIEDGVAFVQSVKGQSLKVVQIGKLSLLRASLATLSNNGDTYTLIANATSQTGRAQFTIAEGYPSHTMLFSVKVKATSPDIYLNRATTRLNETHHSGSGNWEVLSALTTNPSNGSCYLGVMDTRSGEKDAVLFKDPMIIDLTAIFGEGNEPASRAEFAQRLGYNSIEELPYIPYTEGEVVGMRADSIVSKTKYKTVDLSTLDWRDGGTFFYVPSSIFRLPYNDVRFSNGYPVINLDIEDGNNKPCFQRLDSTGALRLWTDQWTTIDQVKQGLQGVKMTYRTEELSELDTYPLDLSTIQHEGQPLFPDGLHGIGDIKDEVDWANGRAVKRIGVVDMGTMSWSKQSPVEGDGYCWRAQLIGGVGVSGNLIAKILTPKYQSDTRTHCLYSPSNHPNIISLYTDKYLRIVDMSFTESLAFKASLAGVPLYYELAEPIEVTFDPAKAFYKVSNGGTEELVADGFTAPLTAEIGYKGQLNGEILNML